MPQYRRMASLNSPEQLSEHLEMLGIDLPFDSEVVTGPGAPLAQSVSVGDTTIGNRFAVLPMEGWDGTAEGKPTDFVRRRWQRFGRSGAKLIWGGEAVAVRPDGRANPNQLCIAPDNLDAIAQLRTDLVDAHQEAFGRTDDLLVGLQLTHSGRFARPGPTNDPKPLVLYDHPLLSQRFADAKPALLSDEDIDLLIEDFIAAAGRAYEAGFQFVDIKHCHGYLGHEFLTAVDRPGRYGGSFENRTRFFRSVVSGIRDQVPGLGIGTRVSAFDIRPYRMGEDAVGEPYPMESTTYQYAFGGNEQGLEPSPTLDEPKAFLDMLGELDVEMVCLTAGSPYYNPHVTRPAFSPPSDGYLPPEDPLVGVARQVNAHATLKKHRPDLVVVGSGYSYLQEWLPNVAQATVRSGMIDIVGLGRMILSYPDLAVDALAGKPLVRKQICRTFSDCTTGPRNGMISGCFPLDPFYKDRPEAAEVKKIKQTIAK